MLVSFVPFFLILVTIDGLLMSLAVGVDSSAKSMGFDDESKEEVSETNRPTKTPPNEEHCADEPESGGISRKMSESSICATEEEDDDEERKIELGPQYTLKEQLEKDKVCLSVCFHFMSFINYCSIILVYFIYVQFFSVLWCLEMIRMMRV